MDLDAIAALLSNEGIRSDAMGDVLHGFLESLARTEDDLLHKRLLKELLQGYVEMEKKVDGLLKNTLPESVAEELKYERGFAPRQYDCTILFSDFVGFTHMAEQIPGELLIRILDDLFSRFDGLIRQHKGTKIKTIGDAYMAVFGAPERFAEHPVMAINAALALQKFISDYREESGQDFHMRIGIHTGTVMAGVVGVERMQFDVFGDNVNIASRFESAGEKGRVNVSEETFLRSREHFSFEERGLIKLKNKPAMRAYFVAGERLNP